jgi:hypothetical protein
MGVLWVRQFDRDGAVEDAFERLPAHTRRVFLAAVAGGVGATITPVSRADAAGLTKSDQGDPELCARPGNITQPRGK